MKQNQRITKVIPFAVILLAFLLMPILGLNSRSWINLFITIVINIVVACSLRVITLSGNISFAHGAFMGVGAYTAGMLGVYLNWPIWLTIPLGAVLATVTGIITGWPFARLKTIYFCMGTMFMGQAIVLLLSSWDLAGGAMALRGIPSLSSALGGLADALGGEVKSYQLVFYLILIVALICLLIMYRFEHSRIGTTLRALAQSEDVAASIGVNPTFYRLLAMGVGCFFAGLMGGFQAHYLTTLSYNSFSMNLTLWLIMYMMIGGKNTFIGPIIGAIVVSFVENIANLLTSLSGSSTNEAFVAFSRWLGTNATYTPFLTAAVLLLVAYLLPNGLAGIPGSIRAAREKRAEKKEIADMMKGGEPK